jgi:hypothetical protein
VILEGGWFTIVYEIRAAKWGNDSFEKIAKDKISKMTKRSLLLYKTKTKPFEQQILK